PPPIASKTHAAPEQSEADQENEDSCQCQLLLRRPAHRVRPSHRKSPFSVVQTLSATKSSQTSGLTSSPCARIEPVTRSATRYTRLIRNSRVFDRFSNSPTIEAAGSGIVAKGTASMKP